MKTGYTHILKHGIAGICLLAWCVSAKSQVRDAIVRLEGSRHIGGYFFMAPYKSNAKSAKEALLNKAMILNAKGEVIYYRNVPIGNDFKLQANGMISLWNGTKWLLLNNELKITDSVSCVNGIETDNHDFLILANGHYILIGKQREQQDLSEKKYFNHRAVAGSKHATVKYDVIQELDEQKQLVSQWNAKNYFKLEDTDPFYLTDTATVDVAHFNSIDEDALGNLLVSARFFNEVLKIDKKTGNIMWRFGGKYNTIRLLNNKQAFLGQHDARFTGPGTFSLFDNGHSYDSLKQNARALIYEVNDSLNTASLLSEYTNPGKLYSQAAGNVQRTKNGYSLVNYGKTSPGNPNITLELLDHTHKQRLSLSFADTMASYRAYYYESCPVNIEQPELKLIHKNGVDYVTSVKPYSHYLWNNGKTEQEIEFVKGNAYYAFLSSDGEVYTRSKTKK